MPALKLQPGASAPEFFLPTPFGVEVGLAPCLLEGPVLVEFVRGTWDPDARRRLVELAAASGRFHEVKTRVLAITCERRAYAARYLQASPCPLTVLVDEDRRVARAYGVLQRFALPVWNIARPSSFAVDRCGYVRFSYVAPLQIHCADLDAILQVLSGI